MTPPPPPPLARVRREVATALTPGPRMVDEFECVLSVLLAIVFGHLAGAQNISWAAFSGYMVMRGHVADSLFRGVLRIVGTGIGALLGLWLTPLVSSSPLAAAAALAIVGAITLYGAITAKHSYAWLFVGLTFAMILLDKLEHPGRALAGFAATRMVEVAAGTSACVLVSMLTTHTLRRRWPARRVPPAQRHGWRPEAARHASQGAAALFLLPLVGAAWRLPELAQGAVTIMAVMLIPLSGIGAGALAPVSRRIVLRVAGCTAGAALAGLTLGLAHLAPAAAAPMLIAGTILGVIIGRHIENSQGAYAYAGTQFTLVVLVALVPDSYARAELAPALARLAGIAVGIALLEPVLVLWRLVSPGKPQAPRDEGSELGGV